MDYLLVCTAALLVSGLTLISGFGLGTLLTPVFALFFPPLCPSLIAACAAASRAIGTRNGEQLT